MAAEPGTATVAAGAAGTALGFAAFGVTEIQFILGAGMMLFGTVARTGFAVQKTLETGGTVNIGATIGALAASFLTAPFLSAVAFMLAKVADFQSDAAIALLLLVAGYGGPDLVKQIMGTVTGIVTSRLQGKGQANEPKP